MWAQPVKNGNKIGQTGYRKSCIIHFHLPKKKKKRIDTNFADNFDQGRRYSADFKHGFLFTKSRYPCQ